MGKVYVLLLVLLTLRLGLYFLSSNPAIEEKVVGCSGACGKVTQVYQDVLPFRQASLLSGIVLGNIGLDRSFRTRLANVGLTHVVAASGMNLT